MSKSQTLRQSILRKALKKFGPSNRSTVMVKGKAISVRYIVQRKLSELKSGNARTKMLPQLR